MRRAFRKPLLRAAAAALAISCVSSNGHKYHDARMDFASIHTVAVLPFANLSRDNLAADRVRDMFASFLLANGSLYVLPDGEVARGLARANVQNGVAPSKEEVLALGKALSAEAVITGTLMEYGELRTGTSAANVISLKLDMFETTTGTVVWSASTTKGGVTFRDRLLGGGGAPMNIVSEDACHELIDKLFN